MNQGNLMVFLHDSSVSHNEHHRIFNVYGEIKEVSLATNLFVAQRLIWIIYVWLTNCLEFLFINFFGTLFVLIFAGGWHIEFWSRYAISQSLVFRANLPQTSSSSNLLDIVSITSLMLTLGSDNPWSENWVSSRTYGLNPVGCNQQHIWIAHKHKEDRAWFSSHNHN